MIRALDNAFYYLDNFQRMLDWIRDRYSDLLADEERAFIDAFPALPRPSRALFVRMVMRKGNLFRTSKLTYGEIGCAADAVRALLPTRWVESDPLLTIDELFEILSKPEIGATFGLSLHEKGASKAAQREALRVQFGAARPFSAWCRNTGDSALRIRAKPLCDRLRLIFFGNSDQDWSEFVLADLGVVRYETVAFSPASRGFQTRRDIDDYLDLQRCKERFIASRAAHEVLRELPTRVFENDWLDSQREKLMFQIAQRLEQQKDWKHALKLYVRSRFPGARARAIRVLEKEAQCGAAFALLTQARMSPENDAERQQLQRMARRLARKLGHVPVPRLRAAPVRRFDLQLPAPRQRPSPESAVRDHLASAGAPVFYVENALINALFGLLCWHAIFAAIPGAFFHPFHRAPADLLSADFARRRAREFADCLAQLETGQYRATIVGNFAAKHGVQSPFLAWDVLSAELIDMALACIPAPHLRKWFERILSDVKANRSGFPDLIQFWTCERRYDMIEVKGPGDRLQDNQLRWIEYCAQHAMPIAVCYLQWCEDAV